MVSPFNLFLLIFLLGLEEAISTSAFSPFLLGIVPSNEMRSAITLNDVSLNIGRGIGPATGGLLVSAVGPATVFLLNALSFAGIVIVLLCARNKKTERTQLSAERMIEAIQAGLRYVFNSPSIHGLLVRVIVFSISISAVPALLPVLARHEPGLNSSGYGILYALFGIGAIVGGIVIIPRAIKQISPDWLTVLATVIFAVCLILLGSLQNLVALGTVMLLAGIAQLMAYSSFSFVLYRSLPNWVMSRIVSVYQLVLQAAIVGGSVLWCLTADGLGIRIALLLAGILLISGLVTRLKFQLKSSNVVEDVSTSSPWPFPALLVEPDLKQGPVLVQIEYQIDPSKISEFVSAMEDLSIIGKRDGAFYWGLFMHDAKKNVYIQVFLVESWVQHLRQHEHITVADV